MKGIGGISGYVFEAHVEWEDKTIDIAFICRESDLNPYEDMEWINPLEPAHYFSAN